MEGAANQKEVFTAFSKRSESNFQMVLTVLEALVMLSASPDSPNKDAFRNNILRTIKEEKESVVITSRLIARMESLQDQSLAAINRLRSLLDDIE